MPPKNQRLYGRLSSLVEAKNTWCGHTLVFLVLRMVIISVISTASLIFCRGSGQAASYRCQVWNPLLYDIRYSSPLPESHWKEWLSSLPLGPLYHTKRWLFHANAGSYQIKQIVQYIMLQYNRFFEWTWFLYLSKHHDINQRILYSSVETLTSRS
jgi:hypothetical protein